MTFDHCKGGKYRMILILPPFLPATMRTILVFTISVVIFQSVVIHKDIRTLPALQYYLRLALIIIVIS